MKGCGPRKQTHIHQRDIRSHINQYKEIKMYRSAKRILRTFSSRGKGYKNILCRSLSAAVLCLAACLPVACDSVIYDDLPECGVQIRFVYDYNMEYANSLPAKVHCLTVLVYDSEGRYVGRYTASRSELADEDWRMQLPLAPGQYHLVAYGGMECSDATFAFANEPAAIPMVDRRVCMTTVKNAVSSARLHDHFHGALDFEVPVQDAGAVVREYKVEMLKNTNNIRILLQHLNGAPAVASDFVFEIVDDNVQFAHDNRLVPASPVTYRPWASGELQIGQNPDGTPTQVAYAELSTSRLVWRGNQGMNRVPAGTQGGESSVASPVLRISNASSGTVIVDIPLLNYLAAAKSEADLDMSAQEFLDRISEWNLTFFLDEKGLWINTHIKVNDWVVRINNVDAAPEI